MANVVGRTLIHKPNSPNIVIEHISGLEANGAIAVLMALGFMKTGVDGVWYDRSHLTIIDNPGMSRKISKEYYPPIPAKYEVLGGPTGAPIKKLGTVTEGSPYTSIAGIEDATPKDK